MSYYAHQPSGRSWSQCRYLSPSCRHRLLDHKRNSSGITNQRGKTDTFVTKADHEQTERIASQILMFHLINQHPIQVHYYALDFWFPSFCQSPSYLRFSCSNTTPSCSFVLLLSTGPGNINVVADGKSVLLILMIGTTWRVGFLLNLLMTSTNHHATNNTISITHFIVILLSSAICQILPPL